MLTLIGLAGGVAGALGLHACWQGYFGIQPTDPLTFIALSLILLGAGTGRLHPGTTSDQHRPHGCAAVRIGSFAFPQHVCVGGETYSPWIPACCHPT